VVCGKRLVLESAPTVHVAGRLEVLTCPKHQGLTALGVESARRVIHVLGARLQEALRVRRG